MEVWRAIEGTKGWIEVSNKGQVRSWLRGEPRLLKTQADGKGYRRLRVTIDREKMSFKVHREVAKAFIPNPNRLPQVNHKDGNKENNSVENLEWVTNMENAHHAIENGLWDSVILGAKRANDLKKRPVFGVGPCGETKIFGSIRDAERHLDSRHIVDVLKGKRNHVKGWTFSYVERGESNGNQPGETERKAEAIFIG